MSSQVRATIFVFITPYPPCTVGSRVISSPSFKGALIPPKSEASTPFIKTTISGLRVPSCSNSLDFSSGVSVSIKYLKSSPNVLPLIVTSLLGSFERPLSTARYLSLTVGIAKTPHQTFQVQRYKLPPRTSSRL